MVTSAKETHQVVPELHEPRAMTVGIATLGLIGGSLALALLERNVAVKVWDRNPATRQLARDAGLETFDEVEDLAAHGVDVLVVASPLFAMPDIMAKIATSVPLRTTITDAGSVKERVRAAVVAAGLEAQYVGAHPMAGTEKSGFVHSDPNLFTGATWGLTVDKTTEFRRAVLVLQLITELLHGKALVTTDQIHDDSVALVSHLPHVFAHALTGGVANSPQRDLAIRLAAGSFRDGTRVARGSAQRNLAMIVDNSRAVSAALDEAMGRLSALADALSSPEVSIEAVEEFFNAGQPLLEIGGVNSSDVDPGANETLSIRQSSWHDQLLSIGQRGLVIQGVELPSEPMAANSTEPESLIVRLCSE